jgi:hypothetical protein
MARKISKGMKAWAQESGSRDGKAEIPSEVWGTGSVPFFIETLAEYQKRAKDLILTSRRELNSKIDAILGRAKEIHFLEKELVNQESYVAKREARIQDIKDTLNGYKEEQPIGRFARVQAISSIIHFPVLLILAAGEYFVTKDAVIKIIGGIGLEPETVAIAVALLTIMGAHLIGTLLKMKLDRQRPQENWVKRITVVLIVSLSSVVIFLAVLRAANTADGKSKSLERVLGKEDLFLVLYLIIFFFLLQAAFLIVGAVMAFLHYSPISHELHSSKRSLILEKRKVKNTQKQLAKLGSDLFLSRELVNAEIESIRAQVELLGAEYVAICSSYKTANIHARRDELDASHPAMQEPDFKFEVNQFDDIIELAEKNFTRERLEK